MYRSVYYGWSGEEEVEGVGGEGVEGVGAEGVEGVGGEGWREEQEERESVCCGSGGWKQVDRLREESIAVGEGERGGLVNESLVRKENGTGGREKRVRIKRKGEKMREVGKEKEKEKS
ncbi:hypothetical protein Pmani_005334 [Petrolisthes manimaculis]|uniref:Uncharacterized protein n=1 Tax=Petrolisthes manimaculis TaxID=1843537 RepID=A0AAE1QCD0_9EUCA|nr:hypothetical protein Pmani_005334 [Petrolisthes manimaculis]